MMDIAQKKIGAFVSACHKAADYGLVRCSSGNMSWRIDEERMLVSASGSWMKEITPNQVTVCRIADTEVLAGPRPSVETVFHAGILRNRPEANVVLHFQTDAATTLASCNPGDVDYFVIPEIPCYIGEIGIIPHLLPGSSELAEATIDVMKTHNLAMMANHGQVTLGENFDDAIQKAVFFELACSIILQGQKNLQPLTPTAVDAILQNMRSGGKV